MKENQFFQQVSRGCLIGSLRILLAIGAMEVLPQHMEALRAEG
jgi:hypothetical protein